ncbi:MAG TPA: Fic family protein [Solirubrobacteraceae bacterium]|nr:Fic family protein [Solirubrobacteraceae bacterium]
MSELAKRHWQAKVADSGLSRRDRRSCDYSAYIPDVLTGRAFALDGDVAADVADAEATIARLNAQASALVDTETLARILLRAESVASSRIEGLEIGVRRLLRAEAGRSMREPSSDVTATEVLGNIDAMLHGLDRVGPGDEITIGLLLEIHSRLLAGTRLEEHGGRFRTVQNWIGGSDYNPCSADFVPPPPELVEGLMGDLVAFCNGEDLPAVAQAAIAHAQFETIHPFVDGNGRTGRTIIHLVLGRRGLAVRVLPPVSLVLATLARDYVGGLTATRYVGSPGSEEARAGANRWIATFAAACTRSVADASDFERRVAELQSGWRERLGRVRASSATDLLLHRLAGAPVLTAESAASLIGRTYNPANEAVQRLVEAGILRQITIGRRNRAYEAPEIIDAFTDLERQLASPAGDTRTSPPVRPAPRRRSSTPSSRAGGSRESARKAGERLVIRHGEALEILADHDPDDANR